MVIEWSSRAYSVFDGLRSGPFDAYSNAISSIVHDFLGQAEIGHFGHVVFGYEDIAGSKVTMDDAFLFQVAHAVANMSVKEKSLVNSLAAVGHLDRLDRLHDKLQELEFG